MNDGEEGVLERVSSFGVLNVYAATDGCKHFGRPEVVKNPEN